MKIKVLFTVFLSILLFVSCKSYEQKLQDKINYTYELLERAYRQPEVNMSVPLGFDLSFTEDELQSHCDKLIETNGGRREGFLIYFNTSVFGGVEREVRMTYFNYFSDPNTQTDELSKIGFIFDEFRNNRSSNGGWTELKRVIDETFDSSWSVSEFDLAQADGSSYKDYYKYWVKDNIAVELHYDAYVSYVTLEFCNVPRYGTKFFKDEIERTLGIKASVKNSIDSTPTYDIQNSPWDGSVWQVKKYLKSSLKDPKSYEGIEWSNVVKDGDTYRVRHKYRAKNSFGAYVVEEYVFVLNEQGTVIDMTSF